MESSGIEQLKKASCLPGIKSAVGMPDLHPGKGIPVGCALMAKGCIYPHLIGNDIGCGMSLWQTGIKRHKLKLDKWFKKLSGLESMWGGDHSAWLKERYVEPTSHDLALGTIGGGNHFAELQEVVDVFDEASYESSGLDRSKLFLLIHSGSRALGESILRSHTDHLGGKPLFVQEDADAFHSYFNRHLNAVAWASANRDLIAHRFLDSIKSSGERVINSPHNYIEEKKLEGESTWIHRKGAASSEQTLAVLPGSRGSYSYLIKPKLSNSQNLWSLAHGAGRKWKRSEVKGRLYAKHSPEALTKTSLGSRVICENKDLLYEEAPEAYRDVDKVLADMVETGLISPVARLKPILTYKTRK